MTKKINKKQESLKQVMLDGTTVYDESGIQFIPDELVDNRVKASYCRGVGVQLDNGIFEFVRVPKKRYESTLLKKLLYGRLSRTKDGGIQLTLKVYPGKNVDVAKVMNTDCKAAILTLKGMKL